jgi:hypothetical protein
MKIEGMKDEYGYPTEAARAYEQTKRQDSTAQVRECRRLPGSTPVYSIWGTQQGKAVQLSLDMPNEATAWINANCQLLPKVGA